MAIRQLRYDEDEILHKRCREVEQVDDRIRAILNDMADTLHHTENGAGLAACQVGLLKRLVVIDMGKGLIKLVNPKIIKVSGQQTCVEGCLSFPHRWGKVLRPYSVTVQALDENGREVQLKGSGDLAKCFCHEIDHLDGITLPDRVFEWLS